MILETRPVISRFTEGEVVFFRKEKPESAYEGKIVVTNDLNPSDIILKFRYARAIVAERGGVTSHGAVLAREMNVPCVILHEAGKKLQENSVVKIDDEGRIDTGGEPPGPLRRRRKLIGKRHRKAGRGWVVNARTIPHSQLQLSLGVREGFEESNKILFGLKRKVEIRAEGGKVFYRNLPTAETIAERILKDPGWYQRKIAERRMFYRRLKRRIRYLIRKVDAKGLTPQDCLDELLQLRPYLKGMRAYIMLTQYPIDVIDEEFYGLGEKLLPRESMARVAGMVVRSKYQERLLKNNLKPPPRDRTITFPPRDFLFIDIEPDYGKSVNLPKDIVASLKKRPESKRKKFLRCVQVLPLMTELADETANTSRTMLTCISHLAYILAKELSERGKIKRVEDIIDLPVEKVEEMMG